MLIVRPVDTFFGPEPPRRIETRRQISQATAVSIEPQQVVVRGEQRPTVQTAPIQRYRLISPTLSQPTPRKASQQQRVVAVLFHTGFQNGDGSIQLTQRHVDRRQIDARVDRKRGAIDRLERPSRGARLA